MDGIKVYENARRVLERAAEAAVKSGRRPEDVTVLAASKMNGRENIGEARRAGIRHFGENRVQELREKLALNAYGDAEVHFIGHLQRNKVKDVTGKVSLIESVDSGELVRLIGKRAAEGGLVQAALIEVNIGGEAQKSGVRPEEIGELLEICGKTEGIFIKGLMAIPPNGGTEGTNTQYFEKMSKLFVDIKGKKYDNVSMDFLSMGMSRDFEAAILAGANLVRVGSAVFGARPYAGT